MQVSDITCGHCKAAIEETVGRVPGVTAASVDVATTSVHVQRTPDMDLGAVEAAIVEVA
ncbi:heavy metal-associated domain-containing protein [Frankia sp. Cas3]|uniref:heavy-metal-associated domain-containing protein n=1 Tax=Frankia sp. Cas3 TaxID=3073926 RepID=UPI002AD34821|nr:heavy metal-associated domain-containing protein [Frankia sp. Cas3]